MKFIEKSKEFGKKHKKTIKGVGIAVASTACIGGAYLLGMKNTNAKWSDMCGKAAFGDGARVTYGPTGDSYKMILEKVVEEVVEC